ncbi:SUKH-3 domain-containing protein [Psychrobacter sp. I-STPA10]|uniref:SUKH-3 domain-containing protein n=1 Tax=Psychrobacter sp. I-STPA10 TaxID=2585769 RepID=UPI001E2E90C8|nr:SUKH-3 domain-containing protein [Psychrobacter sp. I-STPA10]
MEIFLSKKLREVLDNAGYHSKYFIADNDYQRILEIYDEYGIELSSSVKDVLKVFGGRKIYYDNNSISHRESSYCVQFYFDLQNYGGKVRQQYIDYEQQFIQRYEELLKVTRLIPIAVMPSGPMTFYVDNRQQIFGCLDDFVIGYKGKDIWHSLQLLFAGKDIPINPAKTLQELEHERIQKEYGSSAVKKKRKKSKKKK